MGKRTGKEPSVDDTFLWRICHALDETPRELAQGIGVPYSEVKPLLSTRSTVAEIDVDETWWKIYEYINTKMGYMMAVKTELNKALQKDRAKRIIRHIETRAVYDRTN